MPFAQRQRANELGIVTMSPSGTVFRPQDIGTDASPKLMEELPLAEVFVAKLKQHIIETDTSITTDSFHWTKYRVSRLVMGIWFKLGQ